MLREAIILVQILKKRNKKEKKKKEEEEEEEEEEENGEEDGEEGPNQRSILDRACMASQFLTVELGMSLLTVYQLSLR